MSLLSALGGSISEVSISTAFTPPVKIRDPLSPKPGGSGGGILSLLAPKITVRFGEGDEPLEIAPYGEPMVLWPVLAVLVFATVALAGFGGYVLATRK